MTVKRDSTKGAAPDGAAAEQRADDELLPELTKRGITQIRARKLLSSLRPNQQVLDQLEWGDGLIEKASPGTFRNPPGFYIHLLQNNVLVPETFETRRRRQLRATSEAEQSRRAAEIAGRELAYADYMRETVDRYIEESLGEAERRRLYEDKRRELVEQYSYLAGWPKEQVRAVVHCAVQNVVMGRIEFVSFEEFCGAKR